MTPSQVQERLKDRRAYKQILQTNMANLNKKLNMVSEQIDKLVELEKSLTPQEGEATK